MPIAEQPVQGPLSADLQAIVRCLSGHEDQGLRDCGLRVWTAEMAAPDKTRPKDTMHS